MKDLYSLLGLSQRANDALIKSTYYRLAKRFHPDANFGRENARIRDQSCVSRPALPQLL